MSKRLLKGDSMKLSFSPNMTQKCCPLLTKEIGDSLHIAHCIRDRCGIWDGKVGKCGLINPRKVYVVKTI